MAPKTLTDLPPELQLTVVEQISKPSDLKNLCLSCKALRTDALPTLYGRVIIDLDNCALPSLNGWFLADNAGRAYTRCLIFRKAPSEDQNSAWRTMSIALQCLARDSLHQIGIPGTLTLDLDFLLTLSTSQRKLKCVWLPPIGETIAKAALSPPFSWRWLQNLERLVLPYCIDGIGDLQGLHNVLIHAGKLLELRLFTHKSRRDKHLDKQLHDQAQADGLLLKTLFSHVVPFGDGPALSLARLYISQLPLQHTTRNITTAIDFTVLGILSLHSCTDAASLLLNLTNTFSSVRPALRKFSYSGKPLAEGTIEGFLDSFAGLTSLVLRYTAWGKLNLACLNSHAESLKLLVLHVRDTEYEKGAVQPLTLQGVFALCQQCKKLKRIALALPNVHLDDTRAAFRGEFGLAIDELSRLHRLRVLKLVGWPVLPRDGFLKANEDNENSAHRS